MNILLTGSTGFIGKNLKTFLARCDGYDITAPSSGELDLTNTSIVEDYLRDHHIDVILHCANTRPGESDPYRVLDTNLRMFHNLYRCARLVDKLVYFGSGAEYGRYELPPLVREEQFGAVVPQDPYGFAKYIMREAAEHSGNVYDLCLFGVYGPHELWQRRFISSNVVRALHGQPLLVRQNARFDYLNIKDLCQITKWFIENLPKHHCYNVCTGMTATLGHIAEIVRAQIELSLPIEIGKPGWQTEYSGDNTRLLDELGAFSFTGLDIGIRELIEYYRDNLLAYPVDELE